MEALIVKKLWLILIGIFWPLAIGEPPREKRRRKAKAKPKKSSVRKYRAIPKAHKKPAQQKPQPYTPPKLTPAQEAQVASYYAKRDGYFKGGQIPT